jgi:choline kinase
LKTAIILAAGIGSRLRPLTYKMPKCCVPVADVPLISRLVGQLQAVAPKMPIYVVTGYLGTQVRNALVGLDGNIHFIENANYEKTNNMESCRLALAARTETAPSLIINADCVYDSEIVSEMVKAEESCIAADSGVYMPESMKVLLNEGVVRDIAKTIPPGEGVATSIDIYSFVEADLERLLEIMEFFVAKGDLCQWTEVAIAQLVRERNVLCVDTDGRPWVEIDDHNDLQEAARLF